ncbi:MAG: hypothetical protein IPP40_13725 [bacterium]|nr:hypothetical protein [bacterium]
MTLPGELFYDDGTSDRDWSWAGGDGGMAMEFVPPIFPCEVISARAYVTTAGTFDLQILSDGGPNGSPGDVIWSSTITAPVVGWNSVTVPAGDVIINDGSFYVAWYTSPGSTAVFGVDTSSTPGIRVVRGKPQVAGQKTVSERSRRHASRDDSHSGSRESSARNHSCDAYYA